MKIDGKLGFVCDLFGEPEQAERVCRGRHIDFARHPDADDRLTLLLLVLWMSSVVAHAQMEEKRAGGFLAGVTRWFNTQVDAFDGNPVDYLLDADGFDRDAWVQHAMNTLQWGRHPDAPGYHRLRPGNLDALLALPGVAEPIMSRADYEGLTDWPFAP